MNRCFQTGNFLLPKEKNFNTWSVIACDQYTSEPEYWQNVRTIVGDYPSTLNIILPEAELHQMNDARVESITQTMKSYVENGTLEEFENCFIYLERTLLDGSIRQGIVGVIDLERYDIDVKPETKVFATEKTVPERLPPRIAIREKSCIEAGHCVIFCNDPQDHLIGSFAQKKESLEKLYDFDLMTGGGHLAGWLIDGEQAKAFEAELDAYEKDNIYLVGDGNHSLLTAKRCYEKLKETQPREVWENAPARFAMVELENIHSDAMCFEAIYRVVDQTDVKALVDAISALATEDGTPIQIVTMNGCQEMKLPVGENELIVGVVQKFLDEWLSKNAGNIDYIHGKDVVFQLVNRPNAVGILLPDFDKSLLFPYIRNGNITPRKTFSIGHAAEKRYYLEGRKIV